MGSLFESLSESQNKEVPSSGSLFKDNIPPHHESAKDPECSELSKMLCNTLFVQSKGPSSSDLLAQCAAEGANAPKSTTFSKSSPRKPSSASPRLTASPRTSSPYAPKDPLDCLQTSAVTLNPTDGRTYYSSKEMIAIGRSALKLKPLGLDDFLSPSLNISLPKSWSSPKNNSELASKTKWQPRERPESRFERPERSSREPPRTKSKNSWILSKSDKKFDLEREKIKASTHQDSYLKEDEELPEWADFDMMGEMNEEEWQPMCMRVKCTALDVMEQERLKYFEQLGKKVPTRKGATESDEEEKEEKTVDPGFDLLSALQNSAPTDIPVEPLEPSPTSETIVSEQATIDHDLHLDDDSTTDLLSMLRANSGAEASSRQSSRFSAFFAEETVPKKAEEKKDLTSMLKSLKEPERKEVVEVAPPSDLVEPIPAAIDQPLQPKQEEVSPDVDEVLQNLSMPISDALRHATPMSTDPVPLTHGDPAYGRVATKQANDAMQSQINDAMRYEALKKQQIQQARHMQQQYRYQKHQYQGHYAQPQPQVYYTQTPPTQHIYQQSQQQVLQQQMMQQQQAHHQPIHIYKQQYSPEEYGRNLPRPGQITPNVPGSNITLEQEGSAILSKFIPSQQRRIVPNVPQPMSSNHSRRRHQRRQLTSKVSMTSAPDGYPTQHQYFSQVPSPGVYYQQQPM